jgi:putative ABC transport system permease protein
MWRDHIKMALISLSRAKWRSLLTMLGIVIGVVSVITTVSLGEGLKHQVRQQAGQLGSDLITVRPGRVVTRDKNGDITSVHMLAGFGATALTEQDLNLVMHSADIRAAVPLSVIPGLAETPERTFADGPIIATTTGFPNIMRQKVEFGGFFTKDEAERPLAVIGKRVADRLFDSDVPIGRSFRIRGQNFVVRGVFEEFPPSPLALNVDFNAAIFIPYKVATDLMGAAPPIYQILARPVDAKHTPDAVASMQAALVGAHAGQEDFTILKQDENLAITSRVVNLITEVIAGIAAISLLVGGVGIMNIMLVAVTERTHEIGIRKAVGATNRQILSQFVIEAAMLAFSGGLVGIALSLLGNFLIRLFTNLQPVVTVWVVLVAAGMSVVVGLIFGIAPALKAARKDPIEALRYE